MVKRDFKLDVFKTQDHIYKKDINFYRNLSEEEQKGFAPSVVMRWLSGTKTELQIILLNEFVNSRVFDSTFYKHKELLYFLLVICGIKKPFKPIWNKTISKKSSVPTIISVIRKTFGYSSMEALDVLPLLSNDDIIKYAEDLGLQKEELNKIKKELKNR